MADLRLQAPIKYEPKLNSRFVLRFPTDIGIQSWQVKSVNSPKITFDTKELDFMNTTTYYQTHFKWNKMSIVLRDFIGPSTAQALMEWLRLSAESVTGRMGYHVGHAKDLFLDVVGPAGRKISSWYLNKCIVSGDVSFGDFDYTSQEIKEITFDIHPQYCILLF